MGEQPIFSTRGHVFQIDPNTKKSWLPCSKQAVTISFYYDPAKETYRIISVDGSKAIVNSTVVPTMTFTKTSQKFGQWSDPRANTVYGLGFPSESELNKFSEKFQEAKGSPRPSSTSSIGSSSSSSSNSGNALPSAGAVPNGGFSSMTAAVNGISDSSPRKISSPSSIKSGSSSGNEDDSHSPPGITHKPLGNSESQLRYENDRLKMALAQSSANAKKWETELQTLKNNNARLTAALQESTTNVEEWKKQLNAYKEESLKLRKKIQGLESSEQKVESFNALQNEKLTLEGQILQLENFVRQKDEEILNLRQRSAEVNSQLEGMKLENDSLENKNQQLQNRLEQSSLGGSKLNDLNELQLSMADKIHEMSALNTLLASTLQSSPSECNSS